MHPMLMREVVKPHLSPDGAWPVWVRVIHDAVHENVLYEEMTQVLKRVALVPRGHARDELADGVATSFRLGGWPAVWRLLEGHYAASEAPCAGG